MLGPLASRLARRRTLCSRLGRPAATASRALSAAPPNSAAPPLRQRRKSSSKPAAPPGDGEHGSVSPPAETPANAAAPAAKEPAPTPRRRASSKSRSKEGGGASSPAAADSAAATPFNIPSVPSTQHLSYQEINLASFFSLHRPIAVETAAVVPTPTTMDQFTALLTRGSSGAKPAPQQVVYTLASVARSLDQAIHQAEQQQEPGGSHQPQEARQSARQRRKGSEPQRQQTGYIQISGAIDAADLKTVVNEALNRANDRPATSGPPSAGPPYVSLDELIRECRPFHAPPPPVPMPDFPLHPSPTEAASSADAALASPAVPADEVPTAPRPARQPFLDRMWQRQEEWERNQRLRDPPAHPEPAWRAISVRRQRKLKMKKHKYKKLQKRLRNMKRKLDRL